MTWLLALDSTINHALLVYSTVEQILILFHSATCEKSKSLCLLDFDSEEKVAAAAACMTDDRLSTVPWGPATRLAGQPASKRPRSFLLCHLLVTWRILLHGASGRGYPWGRNLAVFLCFARGNLKL